ncbi:MAG TPA: DUF4118 domain-containing protein [Terriglobales bacterium]|nr:DUF4118 domain-containing protein [Terriglobales bacterium]
MKAFRTRDLLKQAPNATRVIRGFLICTLTAVAMTSVFQENGTNTTLPLLFLVVVGLVAWYLGPWAAGAGLTGGGIILAVHLLPPVGSMSVAQEAARVNLVMMLLFGVATVYFYGRRTP